MTKDELKDELPSYADMIEILERFEPRVSGSEQFKIKNIKDVLTQAAVLITCESAIEEEKAIEEINNILR